MRNNNPPSFQPKERTCRQCGKTFTAQNPNTWKCDECFTVVCAVCGKSFRNIRGNRRFCSAECAHKRHPIDRPQKLLTCQWCNEEFHPANGHLKAKYCSQECRYASKRKQDTDKKRNSYEYKQWRDAVYERDNYACQQCGNTGAIQAHHIKPWNDHKELRYDVANGVTLCQTCHENIHGAKLPRASKRFPPKCANCGCATKGRSQYCKSCAMKLSLKAKRQRDSLPRNKNGNFSTVLVEPL